MTDKVRRSHIHVKSDHAATTHGEAPPTPSPVIDHGPSPPCRGPPSPAIPTYLEEHVVGAAEDGHQAVGGRVGREQRGGLNPGDQHRLEDGSVVVHQLLRAHVVNLEPQHHRKLQQRTKDKRKTEWAGLIEVGMVHLPRNQARLQLLCKPKQAATKNPKAGKDTSSADSHCRQPLQAATADSHGKERRQQATSKWFGIWTRDSSSSVMRWRGSLIMSASRRSRVRNELKNPPDELHAAEQRAHGRETRARRG